MGFGTEADRLRRRPNHRQSDRGGDLVCEPIGFRRRPPPHLAWNFSRVRGLPKLQGWRKPPVGFRRMFAALKELLGGSLCTPIWTRRRFQTWKSRSNEPLPIFLALKNAELGDTSLIELSDAHGRVVEPWNHSCEPERSQQQSSASARQLGSKRDHP